MLYAIANAAFYTPELYSKTLLLKTTQTSDAVPTEIKLELSSLGTP